MSELKVCPFCGDVPSITKHHKEDLYGMVHRCKAIGAISFDFTNRERIVTAWNTRADKEIQRELGNGTLLNGPVFDSLYKAYQSELEGIGFMASGVTVDRVFADKARKGAVQQLVVGFIRALSEEAR